jgi:hypothetical protein
MKIKVTSEEELEQIAREALHILANLRASTKLWNEHYGSYYSGRKKYWEGKADEFTEQLQVPANKISAYINFEVNEKKHA